MYPSNLNRKKGTGGTIFFLLFLIFGFYFLNSAFTFITLPSLSETISEQVNKWITVAGGFLFLVGAAYYLKAKKLARYSMASTGYNY